MGAGGLSDDVGIDDLLDADNFVAQGKFGFLQPLASEFVHHVAFDLFIDIAVFYAE